MVGLVIAIMFGWFGGYRFYKKQYGLGFLYMITFGLFVIGWIVDIIQAFKEAFPQKSLLKKLRKNLNYECEVKGSFADSLKVPGLKRWQVVKGLPIGCSLVLETAYYEGVPYFLVCVPGGSDIGALPREMSQYIKAECPDAILSATLIDKEDPNHPHITLKIQKGSQK